VRADHILSLTNVGFAEAGRYVFEISVDGRVEATVPLRVEHIPARALTLPARRAPQHQKAERRRLPAEKLVCRLAHVVDEAVRPGRGARRR
jgi:hypothetical protein